MVTAVSFGSNLIMNLTRFAVLLLATTVLSFPVISPVVGRVATAEDWPTHAHDNQRTNVTSETVAPPLSLRWKFDAKAAPAAGWSRPVNGYGAWKNKSNASYDDAYRTIIVNGSAYFCCSAENRLVAIDLSSGKLRWSFTTDSTPRLAPTFSDGRLYFGTDAGLVHCLDASSGKPIWQFDAALTGEQMLGYGRFSSVWPVRTAVVVEQDKAYFSAGLFPSEGIFSYALNVKTGRLLWRRSMVVNSGDSPTPQGYPLLTQDSIFYTSRVVPTRWSKTDGSAMSFSTPYPNVPKSHEYRYYTAGTYAQVWDEKQLVFGQACLLGYDPDGERIDKYNRKQFGTLLFNWFNARRIAKQQDRVFVATDYHVMCVDRDKLESLSQQECAEIEKLYKQCRVANRRDHVEKHRALVEKFGEEDPLAKQIVNGPLKWGQPGWDTWQEKSPPLFDNLRSKTNWMTPLDATEAMIAAGSIVYVGGENTVYALDVETGKILWQDQTDSRVRAIAAGNEHVLVSTIDGVVRCYKSVENSNELEPANAVVISPSAESSTVPVKPPADSDIAKILVAPENSPSVRGYCLMVGGGDGKVVKDLLLSTDYQITLLDPRPEFVRQLRAVLTRQGFYGSRITVARFADRTLPFPPYQFNLVIEDSSAEKIPAAEMYRVTRPHGGRCCLLSSQASSTPKTLEDGMDNLNFKQRTVGRWTVFTRGALPGSRNWTHNYATAANTYCSEDTLVKGPFGVLWYGEPGPRERVDRHATAPLPLVVNGVMFTQGYDVLMAYDIYNGVRYWQRNIPGVTRTGLPIGTSNMVADEDGLFVVVDNKTCWQLGATTGDTMQKLSPPARGDGSPDYWGWIAKHGKLLYGTRSLHDVKRRSADPKLSDEVFVIDVTTGKLAWNRLTGTIEHDGIALGDGVLLAVTKELTEQEQRQAELTIPRDSSVADRRPVDRRGQELPRDLRKLIAMDAETGELKWQVPFDATDITLDDTVLSNGRVGVAVMVKDGVVVVHGTGSLGHPHKEFLAGEFARRALYTFDVKNGKFLWGGRRNYRKRPIIVGDYIYAEPSAWHLRTGKSKQTLNPLTGELQELDLHRGYIGCSHLLASGAALFGNKNGIGYCNIDSREGFSSFGNLTLGCGIVATPAGGVFVAPEGRSGCTCPDPIHTSVVLYPRKKQRVWGQSTVGGLQDVVSLPVKHAFINLGAPGFREDDQKRLWLPYPKRGGAGLIGGWLPTYKHSAKMFYHYPEELLEIEASKLPWLYRSGYENAKPLQFRLVGENQPAGSYSVVLHFAERDDVAVSIRKFDVKLQGKTVLEGFDIVEAAGGTRRAISRAFDNVEVNDWLTIECRPTDDSELKLPLLSAVEIIQAAKEEWSTEDRSKGSKE
jgi:outer membrane protein assembly factor BamB